MKYNWTEEDIEKSLEEIINKSKQATKEEKSYCLKVIDYLNNYLKTQALPIAPLSKVQSLNLLTQNYYFNERFYSLIKQLYEIYKDHEEEFELAVENCEIIEESNTYFSNEEALTIIHDFFKNTDKELFKYFLELYKNRYKLIKFTKEKSSEGGSCFFVDVVRKNFINVDDTDGMSKLITLAHETGHAVANLYQPKQMYNSQDHFLDEVESIFFELAFINDIAKELNSFEAAKSSMTLLCEMSREAEILTKHKQLVSCWQESNYTIDKQFYENLKKKNLKRNQLQELLYTEIEGNGTYVVSYIITIELLNIYKQDKKSAFEILKKIISMRSQDSYQVINTFFPSLNNLEQETILIQENVNSELMKKLTKNF